MDYTLKQDLKRLSTHPGDPGIAVFRALFLRRAGDEAQRMEQKLRNMILMMPETLEKVRRQSTAPGMPKSAKKLHGHLLNYLYEPRDVIPEDGNGFFGYVDDAYLVTEAYRRTSGRFEPWVNEGLYAAAWVIPAETVQLDALLDGLIAGEPAS